MDRLRTLPQMLDDAALTEAGITFLAPGETRRTYGELRRAAGCVAGALHDARFSRGDLIALVLPDAEQFLTALFGASLAGLVPASVYPPAPGVDMDRYFDATTRALRASGARAVVTTPALAPGFSNLRHRCPDLQAIFVRQEMNAPPLAELLRRPSLDDLAFVQFTSGSTASPKGVALTHRNLAANVEAVNGPRGLDTGAPDVAVTWLPLYHDMGLVGMAFGALHARRPAVILAPQAFVKRPADWLRAISRHRGTISFAPTFGYDLCLRRLKDADLAGLDLSSWRVAGCGAEPVHGPTLAAFARRLAPAGFRSTSLLPSYGLAEHVVAATLAPRGRPPVVERVSSETVAEGGVATLTNDEDEAAVALASCGRPLEGHHLRIVDADGRTLPERHVGEIVLAGPSVMLGYYRREALTAQTIRGGWLHTGDLGYVANGELFVCGRMKDVIIVHGRKYHPQDLEWAVDGLPGVRRGHVVAFGLSEAGHADRIVIVLEARGSTPAETLADSIRRRISDRFGLVVDHVALVPPGTIGRTTSGKVQRAATKAWYSRAELVV
jgi:fatty-acyl-CoA synthase